MEKLKNINWIVRPLPWALYINYLPKKRTPQVNNGKKLWLILCLAIRKVGDCTVKPELMGIEEREGQSRVRPMA
ncbi:hypothetical protein [Thaumasiovibrio subtropicus]|uniref:hypothetical protein n=1 Tax=Thaumasiovibrio subtropicus TaxID=1891207 RepID=UPI00131D221D|nr:hypothetical protein [Thaumasiovibrio subtropicus]